MSSDSEELRPAEREFESALGSLIPVYTGIRQDELMFEAGRRSAHRSVQGWRAVCGVLAASLAAAAFWPVTGKPGGTVDRVARSWQQPSGPEAAAPLGESAYYQVRRRVLEEGLNALPPCPPTPTNSDIETRGVQS